MITDQIANTIYFSHMLEQVCPDLYRSMITLKEKGFQSYSKMSLTTLTTSFIS